MALHPLKKMVLLNAKIMGLSSFNENKSRVKKKKKKSLSTLLKQKRRKSFTNRPRMGNIEQSTEHTTMLCLLTVEI